GTDGEEGDGSVVLAGGAGGEPLAKARVIGPPVRVGGHELAIDDAARRDPSRSRYDLGKVGRQVVEASVLQVNLAVGVAKQHAAQPIPLDLEEVLRRAERSLG